MRCFLSIRVNVHAKALRRAQAKGGISRYANECMNADELAFRRAHHHDVFAAGPLHMKNLRAILSGLLLFVAGLSATFAADKYLLSEAPASETYPNQWHLLTRKGYESAYDETFMTPAWVAYHLSQTTAHDPGVRPDPGYPTDTDSTCQLSASDYPSGYDHGHMASNNTIASFYDDDAQLETFKMTNMVPQRHGLNAGPWKTIESNEVKWTKTNKELWVICGPVYTTTADQDIDPKKRLGPRKIPIPPACFKIIMVKKPDGQIATLAFIMPQENASGHKPKEFLTSVREIERRTGLNFFASMTAAEQDEIEEAVASDIWKTK